MVNKRGWIRVVEATIMILLIFSVLVIASRERKIKSEPDINDLLYKSLDEIAKDDKLRKDAGNGEEKKITLIFLKKENLMPNYLYYDLEICSLSEGCEKDLEELTPGEKDAALAALKNSDTYVSERIIGETDDDGALTGKRMKLYAWKK